MCSPCEIIRSIHCTVQNPYRSRHWRPLPQPKPSPLHAHDAHAHNLADFPARSAEPAPALLRHARADARPCGPGPDHSFDRPARDGPRTAGPLAAGLGVLGLSAGGRYLNPSPRRCTPMTPTPTTSLTSPPGRRNLPRLCFAMLVLTLVLAALDQTILSTALPVMARELPGHWPLAWVFSAYLLAATVVIALYGRLADVLGRKPMLLLAIGLFLAGSLACGASHDLQQLVLARAHRPGSRPGTRSEEHTSELQSQSNLVCRLLLEKKKNTDNCLVRGLTLNMELTAGRL